MGRIYSTISIGTRLHSQSFSVRTRIVGKERCLTTKWASSLLSSNKRNGQLLDHGLIKMSDLETRKTILTASPEIRLIDFGPVYSHKPLKEIKEQTIKRIDHYVDPGYSTKIKREILSRYYFDLDKMCADRKEQSLGFRIKLEAIETLEDLSNAIAADSLPICKTTQAIIELISCKIPALRQAEIFRLPKESPWVEHFFHLGEEVIGFNIGIRDASGCGKYYICLLENDEENIGETARFEAIMNIHRLGDVETIVHEAIHIGQRLKKTEKKERCFRKMLVEGYTSILTKRIIDHIYLTEQPEIVFSYPNERKVVALIIEEIGQEAVETEILKHDSFTLLPQLLGDKFEKLVELFATEKDKHLWVKRAKEILITNSSQNTA
ncbi:MAG: hypothetical protein HQ564_08665 [Candidatus Saganbacteria bacterium]|nr:hypothetical protein [Candidatus Saganbacteria bacterium]